MNTMTTNSKQIKDLRMANCTNWRGLRITINELKKHKIVIAAIQETMWNKSPSQAFSSEGYNNYLVHQPRQGPELSTLLCYVVLEAIVRRVKLQQRVPSSTSRHNSSIMPMISILLAGV
jgi:hypothetical protein